MITPLQPKIYRSSIDPLNVPLYLSQGDNEMIGFNLACDFCRIHSYSSWRENTHGLYLLRGKTENRENMLMGLLETPVLPEPLGEVLNYLQFYNQHGEEVFRAAGISGDYRQVILNHFAKDCTVAVKSAGDNYMTGTGQSHVWIAERLSGKRILLIHF